MNEQKTPSIWKWSVALLVLCNVALILTIWLKPGPVGRNGSNAPRDYVISHLKFSDDQVMQYDVLIKAHRRAMNSLKKESTHYRQLLFGSLAMGGNNVNTDSLIRLIAKDQTQVELITYNHFKQVRSLCTPEQQQEFDLIILDVIKKMNGAMQGGPPPHPGDRQGPPEDGQGPPPENGPPPPDGPQNP
jgi:protein CpxP